MTYSVFLDTNVIADHLLDRNPFSSQIFNLIESSQLIAYASSASFFTLAYLIEDRLKQKSQPILEKVNQDITLIATFQSNLDHSYASGFRDMEDAFQYFTALNETSLNFFVSNNVKDFKSSLSKLPVVSSKDLITLISKDL